MLVEKARRGSVATEVTLEPEVTAPVTKGQRLGTMTVRAGDQILRQLPLVAARDIPRLSYGQILLRTLGKVCGAKETE